LIVPSVKKSTPPARLGVDKMTLWCYTVYNS